MSSPGVVYIRTHLHDKDGFDENSYLQWVEKSISRIIVNPNVHSAFLYKNNEPGADTPYMALYAITNLKQWETEQLALVSRKLPGDIIEEEQSILAALDVSVRNLQFLERCPSETASAGAFTLGDDVSEEEFGRWYKEEGCTNLTRIQGFNRSSRFKLTSSLSSSQTRLARGLQPREQACEEDAAPVLHAFHEFDSTEGPKNFREAMASQWSAKIFATLKSQEYGVYELVKCYGLGILVAK